MSAEPSYVLRTVPASLAYNYLRIFSSPVYAICYARKQCLVTLVVPGRLRKLGITLTF